MTARLSDDGLAALEIWAEVERPRVLAARVAEATAEIRASRVALAQAQECVKELAAAGLNGSARRLRQALALVDADA